MGFHYRFRHAVESMGSGRVEAVRARSSTCGEEHPRRVMEPDPLRLVSGRHYGFRLRLCGVWGVGCVMVLLAGLHLHRPRLREHGSRRPRA